MSALTSDEVLQEGLFHFEGVDELKSSWREGLRPDPFMTVSGWADRHRMLAARASAEPGRYRTSRTPYMREIMDALSPGSPVQRVVFMKAAQVGATEAGNNWIGFIIHQAPGPMLAVQPTVELAKRNSRHRIDPLIEESPALRDRVEPTTPAAPTPPSLTLGSNAQTTSSQSRHLTRRTRRVRLSRWME